MTAEAQSASGSWRRVVIGAVITVAIVGTFLAANAHLLYVAILSQPDCVAHAKTGQGAPGQFSAAKSSC